MMKIQLRYLTVLVITVFFSLTQNAFCQNRHFNIDVTVHFDQVKCGDTLYLVISPFLYMGTRGSQSYAAIAQKDGTVHFNLNQAFKYGYITIKKRILLKGIDDFYPITGSYFWEYEDQIDFKIRQLKQNIQSGFTTAFSGLSSPKYMTIDAIRSKYKEIQRQRRKTGEGKKFTYDPWNFSKDMDTLSINELLSVLDKVKNVISPFSYETLKSDILFFDYIPVLTRLRNIVSNNLVPPQHIDKDSLINKLRLDYLPFVNKERKYVPSGNVTGFYLALFCALNQLEGSFNEYKLANDIIKNTTGPIRENLLTALLTYIGYSPQTKAVYEMVEKYLINTNNIAVFKDLKSQIGLNIGSYSFKDIKNNDVPLSKFKGKLLVLDFWFTGCGGCIKYRKDVLSKIEERYHNDERLQIVSISIDKNIETWKKSIALNTYTNRDGLNLYTGGMADKHPLIKNLGINYMPLPILVDQRGKIIDFDSFRLRDYKQFVQLIDKYIK